MASDMTQQGSSTRALRGAKSVGTLNGTETSPGNEDGPSPSKKRSLFGMLKKKASRGDIPDGEDSPSRTRTNKQASWDAFIEGQEASGGGKIGRIRKLGSKDRTPRNVSDGGGGIDRKLGKYGLDEDITLDTNLDSMEGIIDLNSQSAARRDSSTSGASVASKDGASSSIHASTSNLRWRNGSEPIPQGTFFVDPFNAGRALPPGRQPAPNENEALMPGSALAHRSISGSRKGSAQAAAIRDLRRGSFLSVHSTSSASGTEGPGNARRPSLAGAGAVIMAQQNDNAARKQATYPLVSTAAATSASAAPAVPPPVGPAGIQAASGSAAWTAPESWAVKGDGNGDEAADTEESDEEASEVVESVIPSRPGTAVPRPPPALDAISEGDPGAKDGAAGKASAQNSDYSDSLPLLKPVGVGRRPGTGTKVTPADMSKTVRLACSDSGM